MYVQCSLTSCICVRQCFIPYFLLQAHVQIKTVPNFLQQMDEKLSNTFCHQRQTPARDALIPHSCCIFIYTVWARWQLFVSANVTFSKSFWESQDIVAYVKLVHAGHFLCHIRHHVLLTMFERSDIMSDRVSHIKAAHVGHFRFYVRHVPWPAYVENTVHVYRIARWLHFSVD